MSFISGNSAVLLTELLLGDSIREVEVKRPRVPVPLDVIAVAGRVVLGELMSEVGHTAWGRRIGALAQVQDVLGWCGFDGGATPVKDSDGMLLAELEKMKVLTRVLPEVGCCFARMGRVLKTATCSRAVADCREVNQMCARPPHTPLPSLQKMIDVMRWFKAPAFVSGDYRHWFYQLILPQSVRKLFCFWNGASNRAWHLTVWPMGFSWTPYVGQGASLATIFAAARRVGRQELILEGDDGTEMKCSYKWMKEGVVVAISIAWADNILVVADGATEAVWWKKAIEGSTRQYNVVVKEPGMEVFVGEVTFCGLKWMADGVGGIRWCHCQKNVDEWKEQRLTAKATRTQWASWIGVLFWGWQVSGHRLGKVREIVEVARLVAPRSGQHWGQVLEVPASLFGAVERLWAVLLRNEGHEAAIRKVIGAETIYIVSDAMNTRGAGVMWMVSESAWKMVYVEEWNEDEGLLHINKKEVLAAIRTIKAVVTQGISRVVLGVDNMTARKSLMCGMFPNDEGISEEVWQVLMVCDDLGVELCVVHVPGVENVADEPSRNLDIDQEKGKLSMKRLVTGS